MTNKLTLTLCVLLACLTSIHAQTPVGGGVCFGCPTPQAHIHTSDNPGANITIPLLRFDVPGVPDDAAWEHTLLHVSGVGLRDYSVYSTGYNMTRLKSTEPSFGYRTEIHYQPNTNEEWIEHYLTFSATDGTEKFRPFGLTIDRVTNNVRHVRFATQKMIFTDDYDHQAMMGTMNATSSTFTWGTSSNPSYFRFENNASIPMAQKNTAGTGYISLPFIDSANNLRVGDDANGIHLRSDVGLNSAGPNSIARMWIQSNAVDKAGLLITPTFSGTQTAPLIVLRNAAGNDTFKVMPNGTFYLWDGSTLKPVSVGEPNSCGGARCLTVPN